MSKKPLRIGLIGYSFMGRAHSNAFHQVNHFFPSNYELVPQAVCGRDEAKVKEFEAGLADASKQLELWEGIYEKDKRAVSEEDLVRRRYAVQTCQAQLDAAKANLALLKAGTWKPDLEVARADVAAVRMELICATIWKSRSKTPRAARSVKSHFENTSRANAAMARALSPVRSE